MQGDDLDVVTFFHQACGQAVHGNAPPIHRRARRFVTNLKDAKGGSHGSCREIRMNPASESTCARSWCSKEEQGKRCQCEVLSHIPDHGVSEPTLTICSPTMDKE